jgi:hypothetical protein
VFFSFNENSLKELGDGVFNYDDPLDLANNFLSFFYSPSQPTSVNSGQFKLQLINPNTNIEKILFAKLSAFQPRAWKPQEEETDDTAFLQFMRDSDWGYFRWGYVSPDPDDENVTALSHIHRARLIEVDYDINSNQDRIVTLRFVDDFGFQTRGLADMGLTSQMSRIKIDGTKTYNMSDSFPTSKARRLRAIDEILGERVLSILGYADGYELFNTMSESHREVLRDAVDGVYRKNCEPAFPRSRTPRNQLVPTKIENANQLSIEGIQAHDEDVGWWDNTGQFLFGAWGDKPAPRYMRAVATYEQFLRSLGGIVLAPTEKGAVAADGRVPCPQPSLNHEGLNNNGSPSKPNLKNQGQAENQAKDKAGEAVRIEIIDPLLGPPATGGQNVNALASIGPWYVCDFTYTDGLKVDFTLEELRELYGPLDSNVFGAPTTRFKYISKPLLDEAQKLPPQLQPSFLATNVAGQNGILAEGCMSVIADGVMYAKITELENKYEKSNQENVDGNEHQKSTQAASEAILTTMDECEVPPEPQEGFVVVFEDKGKTPLQLLNSTINGINEMYNLYGSSKRLDIFKIEYSTISEEFRADFEKSLGMEVDWNKKVGCFVLGDSEKMEELAETFAEDIKSFAIQVKNEPTKIKLTSGASKDKTNIITGISFSQSNAKMATALRMAPAFKQNFYRAAERFEDPDFQDKLMSVLQYDWNKLEGQPQYLTKKQERIIGQEKAEFTADVVKLKINAAIRYSETNKESDTNPDIPKLTKDMAEDLRFMLRDDVIDLFFPIERGADGFVDVKTNSGEESIPKTVPYYRKISKYPLGELVRRQWPGNSEPSQEEIAKALGMAAKMEAFTQLQNNISEVNVTTLGIPEIDLIDAEIAKRKVGLFVYEPRDTGNFNWITGEYILQRFTHQIDRSGYKTNFLLYPNRPQIAEEAAKYAFLEDD